MTSPKYAGQMFTKLFLNMKTRLNVCQKIMRPQFWGNKSSQTNEIMLFFLTFNCFFNICTESVPIFTPLVDEITKRLHKLIRKYIKFCVVSWKHLRRQEKICDRRSQGRTKYQLWWTKFKLFTCAVQFS